MDRTVHDVNALDTIALPQIRLQMHLTPSLAVDTAIPCRLGLYGMLENIGF